MEYVSSNTIKSIYYGIFDSYLNYDNLLWGQNINRIKCPTILQKNALRLTNFKARQFRISPLLLS